MMKIIKVFVDELPDCCLECDFGHTESYDENDDNFTFTYYELCIATNKKNYNRDTHPDWCPLVKYCEICEGAGVIFNDYRGVFILCPECQKESEE
jgi:hypothetical protein